MKANIDELCNGDTAADVLIGLTRARLLSNAIMAAAKLNLADCLAEGPKTVDVLATESGADRTSLLRLLRCLSLVGIFEEVEPFCFRESEMSAVLRSDSPDSVRDIVLMDASNWSREGVGRLTECVRSGRPDVDDLYAYLTEHPDDAAILNSAMAAATNRELRALDLIDFSSAKTIADVGGGNGALLSEILRRYPGKRGILADLPGVAEQARPVLESANVLDQCQVMGVDMLESLPFDADTIILKRVLMDWADEDVLRILRNCRASLSQAGRLLMMETLSSSLMGALNDVLLLVFTSGRSRAEEDFSRLLNESGMRMTDVVSLPSGFSVIEARV
jgi:precorrin-6B methylase 2